MTSFKLIRFFALLFILAVPLGAKAMPDCSNWMEDEFWEQADALDVARCLSAGADPNARDQYGFTSLQWAVLYSTAEAMLETVKALLDAGADPNAQSQEDGTALTLALSRASYDDLDDVEEVVRVLLDAGADPNLWSSESEEGYRLYTPLIMAAPGNGREGGVMLEILKAMLDAGADPNADGGITLFQAVQYGNAETVKVLLDAGADPNADPMSNSGITVLHEAAFYGDAEMIRALVDAGADLEARNYREATPLDRARSYEREDVVRALLDAGAREEKRPDSVDIVLPDPVDDCEARRARGENKTCGIR